MKTTEYATLRADGTSASLAIEEGQAEEMSFQELVDHMLYSKTWRTKEDLFLEVFPQAEGRYQFFVEYTRHLVAQYRKAGKPIDGLHDLMIRKLAVDGWFKMIPKSLFRNLRS